jgi:hypothetical protein
MIAFPASSDASPLTGQDLIVSCSPIGSVAM